MRCLAALLAAASLAATGCGAAASAPEEHARAALETFLALCAREDAHAAASALTPLARTAFFAEPDTLSGCARVLRLSPPGAPTPELFHTARIEDVHEHGGIAEAELTVPTGTSTVSLEVTGDAWSVAGPPA